MRTSLIALALVLVGSAAFAEDKEITVTAGEASLKMTVPKDTEVTKKTGRTILHAKGLWIYLWEVTGAKTVADAVPQAAKIIKSEFVEFAVGETKTIQVAGHEAKHLTGKGAEADDNDPGSADVVIFTDGKHVFAACVHGEKDEAAKERPEFLKVLKTVK
ncbi:MAG: hypothetical protein ABJF10_05525 [Chthoniobacter sp.]|uniref:hypothetical protein n=1 Tax=Chthoniobacter sp. TaxID=2510640 RepID=UPI0032AA38EC